nr:MAG: hypothetical protein DIU81_08900 [[Clostridium] cellulosi]
MPTLATGRGSLASSDDRAVLQAEAVDALFKEIDRIATTYEFNTQKLLDGTFSGKLFHIGANSG